MINIEKAKRYCREDISKIENYDKAIADPTRTWDCHHILELTLDGEFAHSHKELMRLGMYYKRPYFELIFITRSEHRKLHGNTKEFKGKMSKVTKGKNTWIKGKVRSEFGRKFKEYYGKTRADDKKLYQRENLWYKRHNNKCRWED